MIFSRGADQLSRGGKRRNWGKKMFVLVIAYVIEVACAGELGKKNEIGWRYFGVTKGKHITAVTAAEV